MTFSPHHRIASAVGEPGQEGGPQSDGTGTIKLYPILSNSDGEGQPSNQRNEGTEERNVSKWNQLKEWVGNHKKEIATALAIMALIAAILGFALIVGVAASGVALTAGYASTTLTVGGHITVAGIALVASGAIGGAGACGYLLGRHHGQAEEAARQTT